MNELVNNYYSEFPVNFRFSMLIIFITFLTKSFSFFTESILMKLDINDKVFLYLLLVNCIEIGYLWFCQELIEFIKQNFLVYFSNIQLMNDLKTPGEL